MTRHVIPDFRFSRRALQADIDFIERHGVTFRFAVDSKDLNILTLRSKGFEHLFYAIGRKSTMRFP